MFATMMATVIGPTIHGRVIPRYTFAGAIVRLTGVYAMLAQALMVDFKVRIVRMIIGTTDVQIFCGIQDRRTVWIVAGFFKGSHACKRSTRLLGLSTAATELLVDIRSLVNAVKT